MSPLDLPRWLLDATPGPPGVAYLAILAFFLAVLVGSACVFFLRKSLFPGNALHVRLARRFGGYGMAAGGSGLLFLAARYLAIPIIQSRVFLALAVLDAVALGVYVFVYLRTSYPAERAAYERAKERDRFVRSSAHASRRRSRKSRR